MALLSAQKELYNENAGIQSLFQQFYKNHFQFTNKFWCVILPPEKVLKAIANNNSDEFQTNETYADGQMDLLYAYHKSINLNSLNVKVSKVNYSGVEHEYATGTEKQPLNLTFFSDMNNTPKYIIETWKSMAVSHYPSKVGYKDDYVGTMLVYGLSGLDDIGDSKKQSVGSKILGVAKDVGKYLVRATGVYQFTDNEPLKIPKSDIRYDISFVRMYKEVFPITIDQIVLDKSEEASIALMPTTFVWADYQDLNFINQTKPSWRFGNDDADEFFNKKTEKLEY